MKALVIGFGSIGARHARILRELGYTVAVVSRHAADIAPCFRLLGDALEKFDPEYVVIANETASHFGTLSELAGHGYCGAVLVEKPLFESMREIPPHRFRAAYVGYNLRFHPLIQELLRRLRDEKLICAQIYAGQHLPAWRPGVDYRSTYSASRAGGGGALRDLSHELDYALQLCGRWLSVTAAGGHFSELQISSDDVYSLTIETERCPIVNVQVNYLDHIGCRQIRFNAERCTIAADLLAGTLQANGTVTGAKSGKDETYIRQHQAVLSGGSAHLCTLEQGIDVLRLIEAAERAACGRNWVKR